ARVGAAGEADRSAAIAVAALNRGAADPVPAVLADLDAVDPDYSAGGYAIAIAVAAIAAEPLLDRGRALARRDPAATGHAIAIAAVARTGRDAVARETHAGENLRACGRGAGQRGNRGSASQKHRDSLHGLNSSPVPDSPHGTRGSRFRTVSSCRCTGCERPCRQRFSCRPPRSCPSASAAADG